MVLGKKDKAPHINEDSYYNDLMPIGFSIKFVQFKLLQLLLVFLVAGQIGNQSFAMQNSKNKFWSWSIDDTTYLLELGENEVTLESEAPAIKVSDRKCNHDLVRNFKAAFVQKLETPQRRKIFPEDYAAIEIQAPKIGTFKVARGSELGLYLIDIKYAVTLLSAKVNSQCSR